VAEQAVSSHHGLETDRTYQRAGFGATVPRGSRPALVVVDLTRGFTEPSFPSGADLTDVVTHTSRLIHVARDHAVPVVFTAISYTPAEADGTSIAWLHKATGMRALRDGSEAVALDPRLPYDRTNDHLIIKKSASAFFGTGLASLLTGLQRDTLLICGATTSGCVRATAVDAVQSGFPVLVPRDCVGDRAPGPHDANLFDIHTKYGDVVEFEDALGYLHHLPDHTTAAH
jgi:nicotinamidase-related amidase